ncbi:hypothetical protein SAMN05421636_102114 [Pricia antarctica]|uniref:Uncharacterized protein n=1 Tax=Pricia antarctica TaxID=641691 RepID=A0A1G6Y6X4_9FLAO|nr:hypothetical protein [Pricia antarctica]SDD85345.1 hypothetical protein SAMN05421636_102114 [Pricia antarctica]
MRNIFLFLTLLFTISSCDKVDELTKFDLEYNSKVVVPGATGINLPFNMLTPDMETNSESQFEVNDTRKDLIEEIRLTKLQMVITAPTNADFSFLKTIEVFISAEGLDEIKIAEKDVDENAGSTLDVDVLDIDLKEYIKKDEFNLRLNTVTDEVINEDHEIDVNSTFFVDAKIFGI